MGPAFRNNDRKAVNPIASVYVIDVSFPAQKAGVTGVQIAALRSVLEHLDEAAGHHVALVTYSNTVHCYDVSAHLSRPKMLVLAGSCPFFFFGCLFLSDAIF